MTNDPNNETHIEVKHKTLSLEITWGKLLTAAAFGLFYFTSPLVNYYWGYSDAHNGSIFASKAYVDKELSQLLEAHRELKTNVDRANQRLDDIDRASKK